jgi:hypothetical protein
MSKQHPSCTGIITSLSALLIGPCLAVTPMNGNDAPSPKPALELGATMAAIRPHASLTDQAQALSRLIGTWDVNYTDMLKDGRRLERTGLFIMGWVMDGHAIQDLWIVDPSPGHAERELYTDMRYFDPKTRSWPTIFVDPEHASMSRFSGGVAKDGRIVFQTSELSSKTNRWSFEGIQSNRFVFRDEASDDDGKTWKLQAEYHMTRRELTPRG